MIHYVSFQILTVAVEAIIGSVSFQAHSSWLYVNDIYVGCKSLRAVCSSEEALLWEAYGFILLLHVLTLTCVVQDVLLLRHGTSLPRSWPHLEPFKMEASGTMIQSDQVFKKRAEYGLIRNVISSCPLVQVPIKSQNRVGYVISGTCFRMALSLDFIARLCRLYP